MEKSFLLFFGSSYNPFVCFCFFVIYLFVFVIHCQVRMDEFSSSLVILFCFGFFICFHFFNEWSLSDQQGFSPLKYPLLQLILQVSFIFVIFCCFFNSSFSGLSDRLRLDPLFDDLLESTPLVLFVVVF